MGNLRAHLRSNVIAYVALFFALATGSAYAANTVFSTDIVDGEVKEADLATNAVTSQKLKNAGITAADLRADSVSGAKVADNSLTGADIDESTLAATDLCRTDGTLVMADDDPEVTICTVGSLKIVAICDNPAGKARAQLVIRSTADNAFVNTVADDDGDFDAGEFSAHINSVSDAPGGTGRIDESGTSFAAGNTDGSQLAGNGTVRATAGAGGVGTGTCDFVVGAVS